MFNGSFLRVCRILRFVKKIRSCLLESGRTKPWCAGLVSQLSAKAQVLLARSRGQWQGESFQQVRQPSISSPVEEDTSKIRDTTGTVFIQGPSIVVSLFNFPTGTIALGSECQSIGTNGKNQRACYLAPTNSPLVHILSFRSQGVVSLFIFPTGQIALDSEPRGRGYAKNMGHDRNRLYSRAIHCPANMEMHYVQWFLLKSMYEIMDCAKNQIFPS